MKTTLKRFYLITILIFGLYFTAHAQQKSVINNDNLFSAGYAAGFIGGMYDGYYPYKSLMQHGDFGIGAPSKLGGELIILHGKIYQTQYTGKTILMSDTGKLPYAVVCFFHADKVYKPGKPLTKAGLFHYLDSVLDNQNGMYAIHLSGNFNYVKTRAFEPLAQKPYLPLAAMLDKQHFFELHNISGEMAGYRLPAFMEGAHITGCHFHFLSDTKDQGGHMIDLIANDITIEIDTLNSYTMDLPQTPDFKNFDFKKDRKDEIKSVENGKKR